MVGQWTYDAYGNVLSADHIHPHAYTRVGHKGLIFERLDVGVADHGEQGAMTPGMFIGHPTCEFDTPRLVPFAKGMYHNRNRTYMPELGRFAQADPNASGMSLLSLPIYHGAAFTPGGVAWDVEARYGDGGSLHAYLRSNPWGSSDPMGLFGFLDILPATTTTAGLQRQHADGVLDAGASIFATAMMVMYGSSYDSMFDAEWAMDWSRADDDYANHGGYIDASKIGQQTGPEGSGEFVVSMGLAGAVRKAFDSHHIITKYKSTGARIVAMLGRHGLTKDQIDGFIKSGANLIDVPRMKHGPGRHLKSYHEMIEKFVDFRITNRASGKSVMQALTEAVDEFKDLLRKGDYDLIKNPRKLVP